MIVIKWIWWLTSLFVMLQYVYWAVLEVAYGLNLHEAPNVTHDWLFLAFAGAAFASGERASTEFKKLTSHSNGDHRS